MLSKANWEETKQKWDLYWKRQNTGRPLMCVTTDKAGITVSEEERKAMRPKDMTEKYLDAQSIVKRFRFYVNTHDFLAESFPNLSLDFGPGSIAAYLGSDITFSPGTVWFHECVDEWEGYPALKFDPENSWFKRHIQLFNDVKQMAGDDFYLTIPDLMENLDVLASLRGAQNTIFDMVDEPEEVMERIKQVQDLYYVYFDKFYDIVKRKENGVDSSAYTVFQIWGRGKTLKLQCDFSAMMSPKQFRSFVQPALIKQCEGADNVLYHLDGPDAIKHMDALMEVEGIDALQWTSGSYNPDGTFEMWYPIYDKAVAAGKGLWVQVYNDDLDAQLKRIDALVKRYGSNALFLLFPGMPRADAERLLEYADKNWSDIEGTVKPRK